MTYIGISQTPYDSVTCIPNSKLRTAIKRIETCKILEEELSLTKKSVSFLEQRLELKDSIITKQNEKFVLFEQKQENYEKMLENLKQQILNEKKISNHLSLKLKTTKINKWIFGGGGLLLGLGAIILAK